LRSHKNELGKQLESTKKLRLGQKGLEVPTDMLLLKQEPGHTGQRGGQNMLLLWKRFLGGNCAGEKSYIILTGTEQIIALRISIYAETGSNTTKFTVHKMLLCENY